MKVHWIILAICSVTHATYFSRMSPLNRMRYSTSFRPGVILQKTWSYPRVVQMPSSRAPYMFYKNTPQRYTVQHYPSNNRPFFTPDLWKTTPRLPVSINDRDHRNAASPTLYVNGGTGAIHTIPAPNLSLADKPIVVPEQTDKAQSISSEPPKSTYQVSEKYSDIPAYQMPRIDAPIGFSKGNTFTAPELQTLVRNGAVLQVAGEYGLPTITMPQALLPQQFTIQGGNGLRTQQNILNNGASGLIIHPNPVSQTDPNLLQKIQNHILQTFPAVAFLPYTADVQLQAVKPETPTIPPQIQVSSETPTQSHIFLFDSDSVTKQTPASFTTSNTKNIVQRETQEGTAKSVPDDFINEKVIKVDQPRNITLELIASESNPVTTTIKYLVENSTEEQKTTPLYFAQVGQTVNDVVAKGFFSAINDVRAAAALAQIHKPNEDATTLQKDNVTIKPEENKMEHIPDTNKTAVDIISTGEALNNEIKPVKVAYTLVRSDEKEPKVSKDGSLYAGQIIEASITEDQDYDKAKASIISKRAPLRLIAITEEEPTTTTTPQPKLTIVKAKIPPKSKLTFDDKTGEPVLRIYASYADNLAQKEIVTSKLSSMKHVKPIPKNHNTLDNWKTAAVQRFDGGTEDEASEFGLKIKARSDDFEPLFDDYEE